MATSQNGWPVLSGYSDPKLTRSPFITGKVLAGDVEWILNDFGSWFNANIEPLDVGVADDWGFAPRNIEGSSVISNHASGTAWDWNAVRHPQFRDTMDAAKEAKIRARLRRYSGAIRWGGDYRTGRIDQMHFEINVSPARLKSIVAGLKGDTVKPVATVKPKPKPAATSDAYTAWMEDLQRNLNLWKTDLAKLEVDGIGGKLTTARIKEWQRRNRGGAYKGTLIDGKPGPLTTAGLGIKTAPKK